MSKITSRNLTYDNTLPPFLARLHATNNSDEHKKNSVTRPAKPRDLEAEAENEPVYFDEESRHTFTKEEWELKHLDNEKSQEENITNKGDEVALEGIKSIVKVGRNTVNHGLRKKRQIGKVIGLEDNESHQDGAQSPDIIAENHDENRTSRFNKGSRAKHGKKIKLSFDE